jgi:hypothetical protein
MRRILLLPKVVLASALALTLGVAGCGTDSSQPLGPRSNSPQEDPAFAQQTTKFQSSGKGANAQFYTEQGCFSFEVSVSSGQMTSKEKSGGSTAPTSQATANVLAVQYNFCTGDFVYYIEGSTSTGVALTVNNLLTTASLQATIPAYDYANLSEVPDVVVDLSWTSTGPVFSTRQQFRTTGPGFAVLFQSSGKSRDATALGSVLAGGVNNTPESSIFAQIGDFRQNDLIVTRE